MNILVIGVGSIALKHITALRQHHPAASVKALRSSHHAPAYEGVENVYAWDEVMAGTKPDFVIISNPTQLHEQSITQALSLNCPLFIEKPVLSDTQNADTLQQQITEKHIITYVACNLRFHPALQFIREYLGTNRREINEVNIYCGSYLPDWRPATDFRKVYSANKAMGGGAHLDLIHEIDYCNWIFGTPQQTLALKRNASSLDIDATDFAAYRLIYEKFTANITLNYYRRDSKREMEIVTAADTFRVDLLKGTVTAVLEDKLLF